MRVYLSRAVGRVVGIGRQFSDWRPLAMTRVLPRCHSGSVISYRFNPVRCRSARSANKGVVVR